MAQHTNCIYCFKNFNKDVEGEQRTSDHVFSSSKTVEKHKFLKTLDFDRITKYRIENFHPVVPVCYKCNSEKGRFEDRFLSRLVCKKNDDSHKKIIEKINRSGSAIYPYTQDNETKFFNCFIKGCYFWVCQKEIKNKIYFIKNFKLTNPSYEINRLDYKVWFYEIFDKIFVKINLYGLYEKYFYFNIVCGSQKQEMK